MSGKSVEKLMEKSVESVEKNSWKSVVSHQSSEILLKNTPMMLFLGFQQCAVYHFSMDFTTVVGDSDPTWSSSTLCCRAGGYVEMKELTSQRIGATRQRNTAVGMLRFALE